MTSRMRGDGSARARRTRKNVAAIIAAAKGMSLVWLNIAPYQAPHRLKRERRDQARARTRNQSRGGGGRRDAADPRDRAENVAQRVGIDRNELGEADRDHIEQAAIEIEVLVGEEIAVGETAAVIGDDQLAVMVLHALIVGDRVVAEGEQRDRRDGCQQQAGGDVIGVRRDSRTHRPPRAAAQLRVTRSLRRQKR